MKTPQPQRLLTSESVSEGHPDKIADQISDAILDAYLGLDPEAKVACETLVTRNLVVVAGEVKSGAVLPMEEIVRETVREIGYTNPADGFDYRTCEVYTRISPQSEDINQSVEKANGELGAGDQGLMFGYATNETPELMPLPIVLAHNLVRRQAEARKKGILPWLKPDAKSQVTVRYCGGQPVSVERVVLSTHHAPEIRDSLIHAGVVSEIIRKVIPETLRHNGTTYFVNPAGRFEQGGPAADTGLTGRKIIVDTYGGACPHGGGAFSGKDPTKVDRSASYMARYIAKNVVAAGLADRCIIQLSYVIGRTDPVSLMVDLQETEKVDEYEVEKIIPELFDLTPRGIIETLDLRRPIYKKTAAYGHFGRELPEFTWERIDKANELRAYFDSN